MITANRSSLRLTSQPLRFVAHWAGQNSCMTSAWAELACTAAGHSVARIRECIRVADSIYDQRRFWERTFWQAKGFDPPCWLLAYHRPPAAQQGDTKSRESALPPEHFPEFALSKIRTLILYRPRHEYK